MHANATTCSSTLAGLPPPFQADFKSANASGFTHLAYHAIPSATNQLAVLSVGDQVKVVGELDVAGQLLQDVNAEALTAQFGVGLRVAEDAGG